MRNVAWVKTTGEIENVEPRDKKLSLEEMQELVGGYIQIVPISKRVLMVVNEEGRLLDLPVNEVATMVSRNAGWIADDDFIFGNVFFCTRGAI